MKYPIGIQTFDQLIEHGFVYVDKTDMVHTLATEGKIYFLSRPRRFGKSLLLSTLKAYFEGKKQLFQGLKIDALEKDWHPHRVFHFDFNGVNFTLPGALEANLEGYLAEWEQEYGITPGVDFNLGSRFEKILKAAAEQSGRGAVVLVDEYDKPLLDVLEQDEELMNRNRETLKAFYSTFKRADASLRFVFLTGVTKFSQASVFSGFNQPQGPAADRRERLCPPLRSRPPQGLSDWHELLVRDGYPRRLGKQGTLEHHPKEQPFIYLSVMKFTFKSCLYLAALLLIG